MSITIPLPFTRCLPLVRHELRRAGLETSYEWNASLDLRDSMGPQVADLRCLFVFDPVALLRHCENASPAASLATVTLESAGAFTRIAVAGQGRSFKRACHALVACRNQLPHLRHAA